MLLDIFSSFDDHNFVFMNFFVLVWVLAFLSLISFLSSFWSLLGLYSSFLSVVFFVVGGLTSRSLGGKLGGSFSMFATLFITLVFVNLFGLIPYMFSVTSHLAANLSLSLPLWLSVVLMGASYDMGGFLSHFQPTGSPSFLNPFLCLIELVSNIVRPVTLSVRLTANLSTGHILMTLLGTSFVGSQYIIGLMVLSVGLFYFMFETGVCFVQAYIFSLLPTLYMDEHPSEGH